MPGTDGAIFSAQPIIAVPIGVLAGVLIGSWKALWPRLSRKALSLAVCLALFPHIFALGTTNNYWAQGSMAAFFWVLAALALLTATTAAKTSWRAVVPLAASAQLLMVISVGKAIEHPYRQDQALRMQTTPLSLGPAGATVLVSEQMATYVGAPAQIAGLAGFRTGDPVIDLTGHYPMSLFALQASAIGQPWTVGGYSGSDEAERRALRLTSCDLIARAWLLTEPPEGEPCRWLSSAVSLRSTRKRAGSPLQPEATRESYEQILLRPVHAAAAVAARCEQQRQRGGNVIQSPRSGFDRPSCLGTTASTRSPLCDQLRRSPTRLPAKFRACALMRRRIPVSILRASSRRASMPTSPPFAAAPTCIALRCSLSQSRIVSRGLRRE